MGMEKSEGSDLNKIIGMGSRLNLYTGQDELVGKTYPSHLRRVLELFELYPIPNYFGITPDEAMALPLDMWYSLVESAKRLHLKRPDKETELLKLLKEVLRLREGE